MSLLRFNKKKTSDAEMVAGLQSRAPQYERLFFNLCRDYFDAHFREAFFDADKKDEVFQQAFIKLWTEIENRRITLVDGQVCRRQADGAYRTMTASLTTFFMTFANNEYRALTSKTSLEMAVDDTCFTTSGDAMADCADEAEEAELRMQIVDDCLSKMSPACAEILILFYYKQKSLDEIMEIRGNRNGSKDGLKTAKNKCLNALRERVNTRCAFFNV